MLCEAALACWPPTGWQQLCTVRVTSSAVGDGAGVLLPSPYLAQIQTLSEWQEIPAVQTISICPPSAPKV